MSPDELSRHLLDYVKDRLNGEQRREIEGLMAADAAIAGEIAYLQGLDGAARLQRAADGRSDTGLGWARLSKALDAAGATAPARPAAANDGGPGAWKWATLALGLVAAAQAMVLIAGPRPDHQENAIYVPVTGSSTGYLVQISFNPDAREADMRALLLRSGGEIVSGPSRVGLYRVRFEDEMARTAALGHFAGLPGLVESAAAE